jgi:uncharacterized protein (DUF305 family)
MRKSVWLAAASAAFLSSAALAQSGQPQHHPSTEAAEPAAPTGTMPGMMQGMMRGMMGSGAGAAGAMAMPDGPTDPVAGAFDAVNRRMHRDMAVAPSGDPDRDFAQAMIPHHQGAIDMAKVILGFGKDAEIRKLAQEIIAAQEKEIAFLQDWLKRNAP